MWVNHDADLLDLTLAATSSKSDGATDDKQQQVAVASHGSQAPPAETVHTTFSHPWLTTDRGWVDSGNLRIGEQVQSLDGRVATVVASILVPGEQEMYDLTVSNVHSFAVGVNSLIVHNCSGGALGKALSKAGLPRLAGNQAHHLIPCQLLKRNPLAAYAFRNGFFNPDAASNGIWLPKQNAVARFFNTIAHRGPHKTTPTL